MPLQKSLQESIDHAKTGVHYRDRRKRLKLSLRKSADKMGISAPYLSDLERGRRNWDEELAQKADKALSK